MMMNFDFCKNEDLNLQNEDFCRLNFNITNQPAFVDKYDSFDNSTQMKSKNKTNSISIDESDKKHSNKRKKFEKWTKEEDETLKELVLVYSGKCWKKVAEHIKGRTEIQCLHRWTKILQPGLVKGPWTIQEDRKLISWVKKFGPKKWSQCSEYIKGRSDKQCRERWFNCLNPKVKKGNWTAEEDYKIFYLYKKYDSKWAQISNFFEGRSENSVKNRFYSTLRRYITEKKKSQGIKKNKKNLNEVKLLKETIAPNVVNYIKPSACPKEELLQYFEISYHEAKINFQKERKFSERDLKLFDLQIDKIDYSDSSKNTQSLMNSQCMLESNNNLSIKNNNTINLYNDKHETKSQSSFSENNCLLKANLNNLNFDMYSGINNSQPDSIKLNMSDSQLSREEAFNLYKNMDIFSLEKNLSDICDDNNLIFQEPQLGYLDNYIDNMIEGIYKNQNENIMNIDTFGHFNHLEGDLNYENIHRNIGMDGLEIFGGDFMQVNNGQVFNSRLNSSKMENSDKNLTYSCDNLSGKNNSESLSNTTMTKSENADEGRKKNEVLNSLHDQLNDLEKLIKSAKRELVKYEKSNRGK